MNWITRHLSYDYWHIGLMDVPIGSLLSTSALPEVRWLPMPPRGTFLADPFLVRINGQNTILCEAFDYRIGKGRIVAIPLAAPTTMEIVLDLPVHVSFPFPVEHNGHLYCIPETAALSEVCLYEVTDAPIRMRKVATLLNDISLCDPVVFRMEERWWLLGTDQRTDPSSTLLAWYADELTGPWRPHLRNPIKQDIGSARSAGTPFLEDGILYRPSQDCSHVYGGRTIINRVSRLTPAEFVEHPVAVVEPVHDGPFPNGLHTVSAAGSTTLVDGKARRYVFSSYLVFAHRYRRLWQMAKEQVL